MTEGSAAAPKLTDRDEFRFLADLVFKRSSGDQTFVALQDQHGGTVRFANNQVIQNVDTRRISFSVTVAFGRRHGTAGTTDLTAGSVQEALTRAERLARVAPEDPEYLPPVEPQSYPTVPTARPETAAAGPSGRLAHARQAIELCRAERLTAAGIVSSCAAAVGVAASNGLFAHEERTEARFSLTAQEGEATGWASAAHRSIDRLAVRERTRFAIDKAKQSVEAKEMPAGRYTVILEAPAVAGLLTWFIWMLDAKAFYKGTSPFSGKLGQRIVDPRLSLKNRPDHPDLLGYGFTSEGLPVNNSTWIDGGVLRQLSYDRFTAKEHGVDRIATLESPLLSGDEWAKAGVGDLIRSTARGVLVTTFWYIRTVNPTDLTLTGMTRDGTFLVEDGRITTAVRNFRFHDSPLRAFNEIEAFTVPEEAVTTETGKLLVPAMKIRDFNFSSVTRF
ncbi:MAG: TldD/PmbA family protein [Nitrospirota bacterium]